VTTKLSRATFPATSVAITVYRYLTPLRTCLSTYAELWALTTTSAAAPWCVRARVILTEPSGSTSVVTQFRTTTPSAGAAVTLNAGVDASYGKATLVALTVLPALSVQLPPTVAVDESGPA
jgi:hypothetical protein